MSVNATARAQIAAIDASVSVIGRPVAGTVRISAQLGSTTPGRSTARGISGACSAHVRSRNAATGIAIA